MGTLGLQARDPITQHHRGAQAGRSNAVIATEDRTFWTNDGIDLGAVFRAFLTNVTSGQIEQGGSTITQQLVKNRILTPKRDVNRKIKEIEDALRLNKKFSKEKILVEYLNTVYFGQGSYGIKAAASRFFHTHRPRRRAARGASASTSSPSARPRCSPGVISNPEGDSPFTYPDRAIRRRADVLRGEVEQKYITQAAGRRGQQGAAADGHARRRTIAAHDFLTAEVLQDLLDDPRLGATDEGAARRRCSRAA